MKGQKKLSRVYHEKTKRWKIQKRVQKTEERIREWGYRILETGEKDGVEVISEGTMADKFPELLKEYIN